MKLICERSDEVGGLIVESTKGADKKFFIEGIFIQTNKKNRNGRIYPRTMMEQEVERYVREHVNTKTAYGELDHPTSPTINMQNVSHLIVELKQDGDNFIGKALITSTPMGNIVKGLISDGASMAVSTRGVGSMTKNATITEVNTYRLSTAADIVASPSAPDAFVRGIMEGAEWVYDIATSSWVAADAVEQIQETFKHTAASKITEEQKFLAFDRFMKKLAGV